MSQRQKIISIAIFAIVYGFAVWLALREGYHTRINFQACPLCEK